jgi:hypothetical protein
MELGFRTLAVAFLLLAMAEAQAGDFTVQAAVPYAQDAIIAGNIKRECRIESQLPEALKRFAAQSGNRVDLVADPGQGPGQVLKMEIIDAQSSGNAWMGHHKSVTVKGWLYKDGQETAKFVARRNSGGGVGAGFKGSCDVLERTVNAIGKDIAGWLNNPTGATQLGDLR